MAIVSTLRYKKKKFTDTEPVEVRILVPGNSGTPGYLNPAKPGKTGCALIYRSCALSEISFHASTGSASFLFLRRTALLKGSFSTLGYQKKNSRTLSLSKCGSWSLAIREPRVI